MDVVQALAEELASPDGMQMIDIGHLPDIDSAGMSARFRICTPRLDREGDIIEPSGVDWTDYANTGVVKYEHGFSGIPLPIAKSIDGNGKLHLEYDFEEDALYARAFHSERDELSAQMFGLIEEGFLRAASIHVIPIPHSSFENEGGQTYAGASHMVEWSECTVGMNPDAYAKALTRESKLSELLNLQLEAADRILERNSIGDRALLPSLAKCLKAVQPTKQATSPGFGDGTHMKLSLTQADVDKMSVVGVAKALSEPARYDSDALKLLKFKAKNFDEAVARMAVDTETLQKAEHPEDLQKADTTEADGLAKSLEEEPLVKMEESVTDEVAPEAAEPEAAPEPAPTMPMGAEVMATYHTDLTGLLANCEAALLQVENPEVKESIQSSCENLRTELAAIEGAFSSIYPEQDALASTEQEASEDMVKAWIADNPRNGHQLQGLAARLGSALSNPAKAKALVGSVIRDLRLLQGRAKSHKPAQGGWTDAEKRWAQSVDQRLEKLIDVFQNQG